MDTFRLKKGFPLKNASKETMCLQSVSSKASFSFAAVKQKRKVTVDPQSRLDPSYCLPLQDQKHYCAHMLKTLQEWCVVQCGHMINQNRWLPLETPLLLQLPFKHLLYIVAYTVLLYTIVVNVRPSKLFSAQWYSQLCWIHYAYKYICDSLVLGPRQPVHARCFFSPHIQRTWFP